MGIAARICFAHRESQFKGVAMPTLLRAVQGAAAQILSPWDSPIQFGFGANTQSSEEVFQSQPFGETRARNLAMIQSSSASPRSPRVGADRKLTSWGCGINQSKFYAAPPSGQDSIGANSHDERCHLGFEDLDIIHLRGGFKAVTSLASHQCLTTLGKTDRQSGDCTTVWFSSGRKTSVILK